MRHDSPLRRLPSNLNAKQALFFDGIRHAVEISEAAYCILVGILTGLALSPPTDQETPGHFTLPFLYAWAVVDAIDRLRGLVTLFPDGGSVDESEYVQKFLTSTRDIRNVRNVSDHLAQRADQIVSQNGTALGELSWITVSSTDPFRVKTCAILPGRLAGKEIRLVNPADINRKPNATDSVTICAGEHIVSISDAITEMNDLISTMEEKVSKFLKGIDHPQDHPGSDLLICIEMQVTDSISGERRFSIVT